MLIKITTLRFTLVWSLLCCFALLLGCDSSNEAIDSESHIEVINLAPNAGALTVYAGDEIIAENVSYGELSAESTLSADESTRIRVFAESSPIPLFDNNKKFNDARNYLIILHRDDKDIDSAISPDNLDVTFDGGETEELPGDQFRIRFGNYVRSDISVDAYLDFSELLSGLFPIEEDIKRSDLTEFRNIDEGTYAVSITRTGSSSPLVSVGGLELRSGKEYSVFLLEDERRQGVYSLKLYETDAVEDTFDNRTH